MKNNIIKLLKAKKNLTDEIKNMTMEEKIKEIEEWYDTLKEMPNDIDFDLLIQIIKTEEEIYYQAKASGVDKKYLKKIEELIDLGKAKLKNRKEENKSELEELFDDSKKRADKFNYKEGDIDIIDSICDTCIYNNQDNKDTCIQYPEGKPEKVLKNDVICAKLKEEDS